MIAAETKLIEKEMKIMETRLRITRNEKHISSTQRGLRLLSLMLIAALLTIDPLTSLAQTSNFCQTFTGAAGMVDPSDYGQVFVQNNSEAMMVRTGNTVRLQYSIPQWGGMTMGYYALGVRYLATNGARVRANVIERPLRTGGRRIVVQFDSNKYAPTSAFQFNQAIGRGYFNYADNNYSLEVIIDNPNGGNAAVESIQLCGTIG